MVGVPRSHGCRICVQRRVRCDGARPICNNCKKGNRPCPGYGPGIKFQDEGPKLREKYRQETSSSSSSPLASNPASQDESDSSRVLSIRSRSGTSTPDTFASIEQRELSGSAEKAGDDISSTRFGNFLPHRNANTYLDVGDGQWGEQWPYRELSNIVPFPMSPKEKSSPSLMFHIASPATTQRQLLAEFTSTILKHDVSFLPSVMRTQERWLSHLPDLTGTHALLDTAVRAVTLVHVGRVYRSETFVMESRTYYGRALRLLNAAVADKEQGADNKTLCATILLSFYEMFASDNDASWVRHAGGAGMLMRMRGPDRHRHGFDRDLFLAYRHTLVVEALANDTPSFLDEPEWRELAKQINNDIITDQQFPPDRVELFNVAAEFHSQMARISTVLSKAQRALLKAVKQFSANKEDLQTVFDELQGCHDNLNLILGRFWTAVESLDHLHIVLPVDDPVITIQYQYPNVFLASFFVGFWTTIMLMNFVLIQIARLLELETKAYVAENRECSFEACRSVDFLLTSSLIGPFFAIYALRFAFLAFKPGQIEQDWVLCRLFEIGDRRMNFAKTLPSAFIDPKAEPLEKLVEKARERLNTFAAAQRFQPTST